MGIINIFLFTLNFFVGCGGDVKVCSPFVHYLSALTSRKTVSSCVSEGLALLHYDPCCFRLQHKPK